MADSIATPQSTYLYTERQAAGRLAVSLASLRRWRRAGIGPRYFKLGGILRYRPEDLDHFIAERLSREVA